MDSKNPSHDPATSPTNAHGGQIATVQVDPPDYNTPPAYEASGGSNASPPSYDSLYGKLKAAKDDSDGNMEFAKKGYGIVCASLCPLINTLVIWGIALASLIMGSIHLNDCPVEKMIPVYLIVYGTVFTIKSFVSSAKYVVNRANDDPGEESKAWSLERLLDCFLLVWFIVGTVYVYRTHRKYQSRDPTLPDYCHGPLYKFAFWTITLNYIWMLLLFVMGCCCVGFMCFGVCSKKASSDLN